MKSIISLFTASNLSRRVALAFLLALLLIAAGFVLSFYSYSRHGDDNKRIQHTYRVINMLDDVLSSMKDVETGTRGFLVSGDSLYLEPYFPAVEKVPAELAELRQLVEDDPAQVEQVNSLDTLMRAGLMASAELIRTRIDRKALPSRLLLGKLRMDEMRETIAAMVAQENTLMKSRDEQQQRSYQRTILVIFLLSLLTFLALIVTYNLLDTELAHRQETENQLRAYEEELQGRIRQLTTSNEELERFAFIASHDLQEPLRKIQSFAGLISERSKNTVNLETSEFISKIVHSADRMSRMIKDLLDFSKVSNQDTDFTYTPLNELIDRVLDDMQLQIKGLDASVQVGALPTLPLLAEPMKQVFANLISNALKYRRPDQQAIIRITAEAIDGQRLPDLMANRSYVKISVSDNGIGFDERYVEQIFQLFQRLHPKTAYDGTGIGLAVCKRIVMAHHGFISARSQPGQGATFVLILPEKQTVIRQERSIISPLAEPKTLKPFPVAQSVRDSDQV